MVFQEKKDHLVQKDSLVFLETQESQEHLVYLDFPDSRAIEEIEGCLEVLEFKEEKDLKETWDNRGLLAQEELQEEQP